MCTFKKKKVTVSQIFLLLSFIREPSHLGERGAAHWGGGVALWWLSAFYPPRAQMRRHHLCSLCVFSGEFFNFVNKFTLSLLPFLGLETQEQHFTGDKLREGCWVALVPCPLWPVSVPRRSCLPVLYQVFIKTSLWIYQCLCEDVLFLTDEATVENSPPVLNFLTSEFQEAWDQRESLPCSSVYQSAR